MNQKDSVPVTSVRGAGLLVKLLKSEADVMTHEPSSSLPNVKQLGRTWRPGLLRKEDSGNGGDF
jgi:hypothetical protein